MRDITPCTFRIRSLPAASAAVVTTAALAGALLVAVPARADDATVSTKADLRSRIEGAASGSATRVLLGTDLTTVDTQDDEVTVPAGAEVVLDLGGRRADLTHVVVSPGATLTITDPTTSNPSGWWPGLAIENGAVGSSAPGGLQIDAGATVRVVHAGVAAFGTTGLPGIGSPASVTSGAGRLVVTDRSGVVARGGSGAAGIGGAPGAQAVDVSVADSLTDATGGAGGAGVGSGRGGAAGAIAVITGAPDDTLGGNEWANLQGVGGTGAAGIGGGMHGTGGAVTALGHGYLSATSGATDPSEGGRASAVGQGQGAPSTAAAFGSLRIGASANLYVPTDSDLAVPAGVTVQNDGSIGLRGTISGAGTVANDGTIGLDTEVLDGPVDAAARVGVAHVTGHNYEVHVDPEGGATTGRTVVHLFSTWLDTYSGIQTPSAPRSGDVLIGWSTRADGTGQSPDDTSLPDIAGVSTDGSAVPLTIHARYGTPTRFTADTMPDAGTALAYDQPLRVAGDGATGYWVEDTDGDGTPIPGLPSGLGLDPLTGRVTGTPTEPGTYTFHVSAGGRQWVSGAVTLSVTAAPRLVTTELPHGRVGAPYSIALASDGAGTRFDVADGDLPAGLTLGVDGVLSGTPTADGRSTFSVRVSGGRGSSTSAVVLDVDAAAPAPVSTTSAPAPAADASPWSAPAVPAAPAPSAPQPATAPAPAAPATTAVSAPAAIPAAPTASAPTAPALPTLQATTAKFGYRLQLGVTASSTLPVRYSMSGDLPTGISLDRTTGAISGVPSEEGTFTATITATNDAGSTSTAVTIIVPAVQRLISTKPLAPVKTGAGAVPVSVSGLLKGERWHMLVDGRIVKTGTMKRAGTLSTTVRLKKAKRDTVHHVVIAGSRRVVDPATSATTSFTITALAAKKRLATMQSVDRHGRTVVAVTRLAAGEHVVVREGRKVVAKGAADETGAFRFASTSLSEGTHHLAVTGATKGRAGRLVVKRSTR